MSAHQSSPSLHFVPSTRGTSPRGLRRVFGALAHAFAALVVAPGALAANEQRVYGESRESAPPSAVQRPSQVIELRQYTLHPGQRDVLIDFFDREFIEPQEAAGMQIIGQFRDLDMPDRFVWLRGFADMPARAKALGTFYGGPVWKAHRAAANATMIDSDNVLLLRPAAAASGFAADDGPRVTHNPMEGGLVVATLYHFDAPVDIDFLDLFARELVPALTEAGTSITASFVSEHSANTFPALPVREGEHVFVWFARYPDQAAYDAYRVALAKSPRWRDAAKSLAQRIQGPPEVLRLAPTTRSRLRGAR